MQSNMAGRLRQDADIIIKESLTACLPDQAVKQALSDWQFPQGKLILIAVGKAAWRMSDTALKLLGSRVTEGLCVTKYGHIMGQIPRVRCLEAGHPIMDENSILAAEEALKMTASLTEQDAVLFLLSGGGSALFEKPLLPLKELQDITSQLLGCGAGIQEINTIRKRLSGVKGGKFALSCAPASVYSIVLSDIIGDPLDMIASGPTAPDSSTAEEALAIAEKYRLQLSPQALELLRQETPKTLNNVTFKITGSVKLLCKAAAESAERLGYRPVVLTDTLDCEAREAGRFLAAIARFHQNTEESLAFIAGGETVVHLTGKGKGGRNQELALAAAPGIESCRNTALFSIGSDGTDGPTDAAGGYTDFLSAKRLREKGISISAVLENNDAYHALRAVGGLILTGPTGTNVNDAAVLLIRRQSAFYEGE